MLSLRYIWGFSSELTFTNLKDLSSVYPSGACVYLESYFTGSKAHVRADPYWGFKVNTSLYSREVSKCNKRKPLKLKHFENMEY